MTSFGYSKTAFLKRFDAIKKLFFIALFLCSTLVRAQEPALTAQEALQKADPKSAEGLPKELEKIDITPVLGAQLPKNITLMRHDGAVVELGSYFDDRRPVIFVMAYYSCPMLCTLVLNGLVKGLQGVGWNAGNEFRVVAVSIDPRDTTSIAAQKRDNYLAEYGRLVKADAFDFLTGTQGNVEQLAKSLGFRYQWDEATQQYVHAAGIFVVTPKGTLSQVHYGISFEPETLRLSLMEASQGSIGSPAEKMLLFCFTYDPHVGKYVLAAGRLMKLSGVLTMLFVGLWMRWMWRKENLKIPKIAV